MRNVFVSYKFRDGSVFQTGVRGYCGHTIVRDYVDRAARIIDSVSGYRYYGEYGWEDNSRLRWEEIEEILKEKMFHSSITIIFISPDMFEGVEEIEQWVAWEISYSLKNKTRGGVRSNSNAILAVVLPDRNGDYGYAMYRSYGGRTYLKRRAFFRIVWDNIFNRRGWHYRRDRYGNLEYRDGCGYVAVARWEDFVRDSGYHLGVALGNRGRWEEFDIRKNLGDDWIS